MSLDDDAWKSEFSAAQHTQLATVRASADKWAGGIAAAVGAFTTFSVVLAPSKISDLPNGIFKGIGLALAVTAGVLGTIALIRATLAASGAPTLNAGATWEDYKADVVKKAAAAARSLKASRTLTFLAIAALVVSALCSQLAGLTAQSAAPSFIVVTRTGDAVCGPLTTDKTAVYIGGTRVSDAASITAVTSCGTDSSPKP